MQPIQWISIAVAVGLWAVVRFWLSLSARRRAKQAGDSKVVVTLSPRTIFGFLVVLGLIISAVTSLLDVTQGKTVSINEAMFGIAAGGFGGALIGGVIWLVLWLVGKLRRKDPSQHF